MTLNIQSRTFHWYELNTIHVGKGKVRCYRPQTRDELQILLRHFPEIICLGSGSNTIGTDQDFTFPVLQLRAPCFQIMEQTQAQLTLGAGVLLSRAARYFLKQSPAITNFVPLANIPGTLGGALHGNAGAHGWNIFDSLLSIEFYLPNKGFFRCSKDEIPHEYRSATLPKGAIIVSADFQIVSNPEHTLETIKENKAWRQSHQLALPSAGSTFKNPPGHAAGQLIEACGLKGYCVGPLEVAQQHANFIVNTAHAASEHDYMQLIYHIQNSVFQHFHINLEEEVQRINKEIAL